MRSNDSIVVFSQEKSAATFHIFSHEMDRPL